MYNIEIMIARTMAILAIALAPVVWLSPAFATAGRKDSYPAVRAPSPPPVTGSLDDLKSPAWAAAFIARDFEDITGRRAAPLATTAYFLYDAQNLYVAFTCEQSGVPIVASQTTNDVGLNLDDNVALGIDTAGNGSHWYYFIATPRGVRYQKSSESQRFSPLWTARAAVDGTAWMAELVIPLKNLRAQSTPVQTWRFNFSRHFAADQRFYTWAYDPQMFGFDDTTYWPSLTDIRISQTAARPQPRAELYGLASAGSDRNLFAQASGAFATQTPRWYGVDATYPFTNTMAVVGTLNPDFSNVETDQATITPQQFQRALSEYRPFFAQGAQFLTPGIHFSINAPANNIFFSPTIGTFDRGLKVEGTAGLNAVGLLEVKGSGFDDVAFGFNHVSAEQDFRYFADGVLANHGNGRDSTVEFGARKSNLKSGLEAAAGYGGESGAFVPAQGLARNFITIESASRRNYEVHAGIRDIGPYYNPVDGFTLLNDIRGSLVSSEVRGVGKEKGPLKSMYLDFSGERYLDHSGAVHYAEMSAYGSVTFKNLLTVSGGPWTSELRFYGQGYPSYTNGRTFAFNSPSIQIGYRDGTDSPTDASYTWGPFATSCPSSPPFPTFCVANPSTFVPFFLQQVSASTTRQVNPKVNIALTYAGTAEHPYSGGQADGQSLRRFTLGESLGPNSNVSLSIRSISGTGGFAAPGVNFAGAFHEKFGTGSELFIDYGSPAANRTLHRLIVKYILHLGGGTGT